MSLGPIRPRFRMVVPGAVEDQIARLEVAVARPDSGCVARTVDNHVDVTVVTADRHRWSPCVQLEFRASGSDTMIDGLIGPHPSTWTLFAFANATIVLAASFGLMMGLVQLSLERSAWWLWSVPIALGLLGLMYLASQTGRRLAADQTQQLMRLVEDAMGTTAS